MQKTLVFKQICEKKWFWSVYMKLFVNYISH